MNEIVQDLLPICALNIRKHKFYFFGNREDRHKESILFHFWLYFAVRRSRGENLSYHSKFCMKNNPDLIVLLQQMEEDT